MTITNQKKCSTKIKIFFIVGVVVSIIFWIELTKAGYFPNFLNSTLLCPRGSIEYAPKIPFDFSCPTNTKIHRICEIKENDKKCPPLKEVCGEIECIKIEKSSLEDTESSSTTNPAHLFGKPIIYFYPITKQEIKVELDYQGEIIADYPTYDKNIKGWEIIAYPDGKIINKIDNKEYSYLFWEGLPSKSIDWDFSTGFIIKGEEIKEFLQQTLSKIGLTPKEYNEFIVYWYPKMKDNKYNLIHFADKQYTEIAPLIITPKPDSILRVFMVFKPLSEEIAIKPQEIKTFERKGFTVIERLNKKTPRKISGCF